MALLFTVLFKATSFSQHNCQYVFYASYNFSTEIDFASSDICEGMLKLFLLIRKYVQLITEKLSFQYFSEWKNKHFK